MSLRIRYEDSQSWNSVLYWDH